MCRLATHTHTHNVERAHKRGHSAARRACFRLLDCSLRLAGKQFSWLQRQQRRASSQLPPPPLLLLLCRSKLLQLRQLRRRDAARANQTRCLRRAVAAPLMGLSHFPGAFQDANSFRLRRRINYVKLSRYTCTCAPTCFACCVTAAAAIGWQFAACVQSANEREELPPALQLTSSF